MSSTEKFDTSTPMGQAMLNICIVFPTEGVQKAITGRMVLPLSAGLQMGGKTPTSFGQSLM
ncbi:hypothetical protein [Neglectibacter timonensis]|uniref:hypothetical protein n=1 Tax=Neglectibacter timonensis TaxID=1776382 RepID=UPI003995ABE5